MRLGPALQIGFAFWLLLGPLALPAQPPTALQLRALNERQLVVVVERLENNTITRLLESGRMADIEAYEAQVDQLNKTLIMGSIRAWQPDREPVYRFRNEWKRMVDSANNNYAYLLIQLRAARQPRAGLAFAWRSLGSYADLWDQQDEAGAQAGDDAAQPTGYFSQIEIGLTDVSSPLFTLPLPQLVPQLADVVFGLNLLKQYVHAQQAKQNAEQLLRSQAALLPDLNLCLREEWLAPGLDSAKIAQVYPYPFQLVDSATFNQIVNEQQAGYAYVQLLPFVVEKAGPKGPVLSLEWFHYVMDAGTGKWLARAPAEQGLEGAGCHISVQTLKAYQAQLPRRKTTTPK